VQVDDGHMGNIEHSGMPAHGMMFLFLRAVVQRHIPATEIHDLGAGFNVLLMFRCLLAHTSLRRNAKRAAGLSTCRPSVLKNLRDQ